MEKWIEELPRWIEEETICPEMDLLAEEVRKTECETDSLLQASSDLEAIYSELLEKIGHASS